MRRTRRVALARTGGVGGPHANPSIAVLSDGGTASGASTGSASTSPRESATGAVSRVEGEQRARTCARLLEAGSQPSRSTRSARKRRKRGRGPLSEGDLDDRPQVVLFLSHVVATGGEDAAVDRDLADQVADGVGELDLTSHPGFHAGRSPRRSRMGGRSARSPRGPTGRLPVRASRPRSTRITPSLTSATAAEP